MKWFIYFIFIVLFVGVTFFGLGPVVLADGSTKERVITLIAVLVIYALLILMLIKWKKWK